VTALIVIGSILLALHLLFPYLVRRYFWGPKIEVTSGLSDYVDPSLEPLAKLRESFEKSESRNLEAFKKLSALMEGVPARTLNTIQGSANTTTGKLGELIKFIELQRVYDRIFPVGDIIDFIGIRFPSGEDKGAIDLIEIKTGDNATLNQDQKKLRDMITNSKDSINFKVVRVEIT
jgi:predicted Holliday junction resolvase-like endonuclease